MKDLSFSSFKNGYLSSAQDELVMISVNPATHPGPKLSTKTNLKETE